eukprot:TRINITY_DN64287_c0_g1_i1.p1 TRINITY_DN64287_c0_g1~~TRINITY_DN64287_c0_g1_i1.p1  ORF type:complete len:182 (-),score=29.95 TRINITY_DN64287_c0_g1_i1:51-596(-)
MSEESYLRRGPDGLFHCKVCMVSVPTLETIRNHLRGKEHIKRRKQAEERNISEGKLPRDGRFGYRTGPEEMAKLTSDERRQMNDLTIANENLRRLIQNAEKKNEHCRKNHGHMKTLQEKLEQLKAKKFQLQQKNQELVEELKDLDQPGIKKKKRNRGQHSEEEREYAEFDNGRVKAEICLD